MVSPQQSILIGRPVVLPSSPAWPRVLAAPLLFYATCFSTLGLVALFCAEVSQTVLYGGAAISLLLAIALTARDPLGALFLTVMFTHIGPIVRFQLPGLGWLNLGDLFLAVLTVKLFPILASSHPGRWLREYRGRTLALVFFAIMAVLFSPAWPQVIPGAVSVLQLALVYAFVRCTVKTYEQANFLIVMIAFAVLVNAGLHLVFYNKGVTLLLTEDPLPQFDLSRAKFFFKTSHFYPTFIASCNVAIVISVRRLVLGSKIQRRMVVFWAGTLCLAMTSILVSGNRTVIATSAIVSVLIVLTGVRPRRSFRIATIGLFAVLVIPTLIAALYWQQQTLPMAQMIAFQRMFYEDAPISFGDRWTMWKAFVPHSLDAPKELLVGLGPDVPMRAPDVDAVRSLMYVKELAFQVPSWHNFYLDVISQFGLPFFCLFISVIISTLLGLFRVLKRGDDWLAYDCLFAIVAWLILWNTHATGWTKPVLILAQLFALAHSLAAGGIVNRPAADTNIRRQSV
jgi:O-antigen ligase/polysaccharide polymerase Wzy-like membrane protein